MRPARRRPGARSIRGKRARRITLRKSRHRASSIAERGSAEHFPPATLRRRAEATRCDSQRTCAAHMQRRGDRARRGRGYSVCRAGSHRFDLLREFFGLVLLIRAPDQLLDLAVHDVVELVQRQIDAVVGDPALREIIGADAFGAVARADLELAGLRLLARCFSRSVASSRAFSSDMARERFLCCERSSWHSTTMPGGDVRDADRRVGLVDVLAAGARGAEGIDAQVRRVQLDGLDLLELRQNGDGARRRCECAPGPRWPARAARGGCRIRT